MMHNFCCTDLIDVGIEAYFVNFSNLNINSKEITDRTEWQKLFELEIEIICKHDLI